MTDTKKIEALKNFLECDFKESKKLIEEGDYLVLTDEEAEEKAREEILSSLWAFRADFILKHTKNFKNMYNHEKKAALNALEEAQKNACESLNGLVFALIEDINDFINDAINCDGRGHFISLYNGEENESGEFFIYRIN